jgi:hypothetical protein
MSTVVNVQEFRDKWGIETPGLLIARFIELAPEFPGDKLLAERLGEMVADLESALKSLPRKE